MRYPPKDLECKVAPLTSRIAYLVFSHKDESVVHCLRMNLKLAKEIKRRWDVADKEK